MKINIFWEGKRESRIKGTRKKGIASHLRPNEVRKMVKKIIMDLGIRGNELNIIFCSGPYLRRLSKRYLKKDYIPACLSFPFLEEGNGFLGEIYLNYHSLNIFPLPYLLRHALSHLMPKKKRKRRANHRI